MELNLTLLIPLSIIIIICAIIYRLFNDYKFNLKKKKFFEEDNFLNELVNYKNNLDKTWKFNYLNKSKKNTVKEQLLIYKKKFVEFNSLYNDYLQDNEVNKSFINIFKDIDKFLSNYTTTYIENELLVHKIYFDNLTKFGLDEQQRKAIVIDEENNLIIAGAGTGKTTTIYGKVKYLTEKKGINPENILLLSYTKSSANDLVERINVPKVHASTFHSLGFNIFRNANRNNFNVISEAEIKYFIKLQIKKELEDPNYLALVINYFLEYLKEYKPQSEFESQNEYIQYIKDNNFRPYFKDSTQTYKMDVVKSLEECAIANFLYFNNIDYEYEAPYITNENDPLVDFHRYRPDFKIYRNKEKNDFIYLEHFAIDKNGNVPKWFKSNTPSKSATREYNDAINWKRDLHQKYNTVLIESYSYEFSNNLIFENLKKSLLQNQINLNPKSNEEIISIIKESSNQEYKAFEDLIGTFIGLMKSNLENIESLISKANLVDDDFERTRALNFLEIIRPIFLAYQNHLKNTVKIDFNDMINQAIELVKAGHYSKKIDYIIIDEFQDIAQNRYKLIKEILNFNPNSKLFCVGDDWQSIYRFASSDIGIFLEFEKYFGNSEISFIETTYRFGKNLIDLSNQFILKNPYQSKKNLKAKLSLINDIQFISYDSYQNVENLIKEKGNNAISKIKDQGLESTFKEYYGKFDSELKHIEDIFNQIYYDYNDTITKDDILILARYNYIFESLKNSSFYYNLIFESIESYDDNNNKIFEYFISKKFEDGTIIKGTFMSVHKSKGLEAKVVILLRCDAGKYGFPSEISDDRVLNLLLSTSDQFPNGEERRLFYVALTRAKEKIYIISDLNNRSKFINELDFNNLISTDDLKICPSCNNVPIKFQKRFTSKSGILFDKYICRNYSYGCYYTEVEKVISYA